MWLGARKLCTSASPVIGLVDSEPALDRSSDRCVGDVDAVSAESWKFVQKEIAASAALGLQVLVDTYRSPWGGTASYGGASQGPVSSFVKRKFTTS